MATLGAFFWTILLVGTLADDCGGSSRLLAASDVKPISLGDSGRRLAEDCGARRLESSDAYSIVLDDIEANGTRWHRGTYSPCLEDAHGGMFHHDWARDKGQVSAEYKFDPPEDGCYVIEEYHPGQNQACSKYLPNNARVDVDYCKGKSTYTYVDQSQGGGKWNIVGALPFFVGWEGRIKVANSGTATTCQLGSNCFWVADAFKVTWVSNLSSGCRVPDAMIEAAEKEAAETSSAAVETKAMTSSSTEAAEKMTLNPAEALSALQTMVDDLGLNFSSAWQKYEFRSDNDALKCGAQGWKQAFLYLDPSSSEDAGDAVEFPFDPPEDGCYVVEEFHPENVCIVPFSSEVALTVHYCKGMKRVGSIDQTRNGNRWNTVGLFPFYKGFPGKVLISHPQVGSGVAVADVIRFTRVSNSCADAETKAMQYIRLAQNAPAVVVDNRHPANTHMSSTHKCGQNAIGKSFHAAIKGEAEAHFKFEPSSTGCYRIDSYHPENEQENQCKLADSANLEINWCFGGHREQNLPLRGNGNQWNTLGHFKYFAGKSGNVISRRSHESADGEYWVADAVRFTKVAEACNEIPDIGLVTLHIEGSELKDLNPATLDAGLTSHPDMRIALHQAIVEETHLPHDSVRLLSIRKGSIIADFEVRGPMHLVKTSLSLIDSQITGRKESRLKNALCRAVISDSIADCAVTVLQLRTVPSPHGTENQEVTGSIRNWLDELLVSFERNLVLVPAVVIFFLMLVCLVTSLFIRRCKKVRGTWHDPVVPVPADQSFDADKVGDEEKGKLDDEIRSCQSTITPKSFTADDIEIQSVASDAKLEDAPAAES